MTLPGANLASNELLLKLCKAYFALRQLTDQAGVSLLIGSACPLALGSPHITEFLHDFHLQATTSCTTHELSPF